MLLNTEKAPSFFANSIDLSETSRPIALHPAALNHLHSQLAN